MKRKFIVSIITLVALACKGPKSIYQFPENMSADVVASYTESCEKGKVLYELNCARCHNKTEKGKVILPDFTSEQLSNYEFRVANNSHEENLNETKVTSDELIHIINFLTYKKSSIKDKK